MPTGPTNSYRRRDREMAERVQHGLSLLYRTGAAEAYQYMALEAIPAEIIERVISARHVRGARVPVRIECYSGICAEDSHLRDGAMRRSEHQDRGQATTP